MTRRITRNESTAERVMSEEDDKLETDVNEDDAPGKDEDDETGEDIATEEEPPGLSKNGGMSEKDASSTKHDASWADVAERTDRQQPQRGHAYFYFYCRIKSGVGTDGTTRSSLDDVSKFHSFARPTTCRSISFDSASSGIRCYRDLEVDA